MDEEVDDTAAKVIAEEDANDSSDTEIDRAADSIEETESEDEVQDTDAAEDRNDREDSDEETRSGTNPGETGPSDAETEEDVSDSWEETPKIDSELEAAIASEDPFSYYDDDASEEEMDDDIALLAAGKTMAHEDYAYTDVSSGTEYMVDLYTDHTAKIWKLTTSSGGAECILPSTIYYTDDDDVPEPTPYTVTELRFSPYGNSVTSVNNNYTALVLPDTLTDIGGSLSGFKNVTEITIPGSVKVFNATLQYMIPSSSSAKPVKISYGRPFNKPTKAIHFSRLFWNFTTSASNSRVAGGNDLVVFDDDSAVDPPQAGRAFEHRFGNVEVIVFLADARHGESSS